MHAGESVRESTVDWALEQARTGDPKAVALLYDLHHDAVRAFATRLLGEVSAAEDLVHEVFVKLPGALRRFRGDSSLRTFLLGITSNRAKHYIRSASRRRAAHQRMATSVPQPTSTDPEALAQQRELAVLIQSAMERLPMDQRVAFVLCEVEERTSAEAAEIVGVPPATIRTRLFHARRKLRAYLEKKEVR